EGRELAPGEAAADAEAKTAAAEMVEHRDLLGDAKGIVPGQDDRGGAEPDVRTLRGEIGHELQVVGAERVVVEVVLDRPQQVEAQVDGLPGEAQLLVPDLLVGHVAPAVAGEDHLQADVHRVLPLRSARAARARGPNGPAGPAAIRAGRARGA